MGLNTDTGGVVVNADIKLSNRYTTWNTRLDKIGQTDNELIIISFSLSNVSYIEKILSKRENGRGITLIGNTAYYKNAVSLKRMLPEMKIYIHPQVHAKLILYAPGTVWLSSENIGHRPKAFDATIEIESNFVYNHYFSQVESLFRSRDIYEIKEVQNHA